MQHSFEGHGDYDVVTRESTLVGGDQFTTIVIDGVSNPFGNEKISYSAAAALEGDIGVLIDVTGGTSSLRWTLPSPGARGVARRPLRVISGRGIGLTRPTSGYMSFLALRGTSDGLVAEAVVTSSGYITVRLTGGVPLASMQYAFSDDTWYWVELAATKGVDATSGEVELRVYASNGTTLLHSSSLSSINTGVTDVATVRFGGIGDGTDAFDSLQFKALASGWLGEMPPPAPVIEPISAIKAEPFEVVTIEPAAWPDPTTWTWRRVSGPSVTLTDLGDGVVQFTTPAMHPHALTPLLLGVTGTRDGVTSEETVVPVTLLPHLVWSRTPAAPTFAPLEVKSRRPGTGWS